MSPHRIRRTPLERFIRFVFGTVLIGCIVLAFYLIPYDILREERARLYGEQRTTGVVLSARSVEVDDMPDARLVIEYKYVDPDGYARIASARLPNRVWQQYRPGKVIKVIFVRTRPDLVRVPDEVEPAFQLWLRDLMD